MAEMDLFYKIIVLKMLDKAQFALSNMQITEFFLENEYTDYFNAQMAINELADTGLLNVKESHGNTEYELNEDGLKSLELFSDKITPEIDKDLTEYLGKNRVEMIEENSVKAFYSEVSTGGYRVVCQMKSKEKIIFECNCVVTSKEQAEAMCNNWKAKYEMLYFEFLDKLTV